MNEPATELEHYARKVDLDPQRLASVDQRVSSLHALSRKFKLPVDQLAQTFGLWQERLTALRLAQDETALRAEEIKLKLQFEQAAAALSKKRSAAAKKMAKEVLQTIQSLGMAGGKFEIQVKTGEPQSSGTDIVEFLVAGHSGASLRPLSKVASGGELSRISLAIAVAAARANPVPTLIFDEADAGVGGAVAEMIGKLMRQLGDSCQVLCVTHLPQVAAQGHTHFQVLKAAVDDGATRSRVTRLNKADRVEEVARMLGGVEITSTTRRHAKELIAG
jgi:DNA repair protein RecN (Recombination protein N)